MNHNSPSPYKDTLTSHRSLHFYLGQARGSTQHIHIPTIDDSPLLSKERKETDKNPEVEASWQAGIKR